MNPITIRVIAGMGIVAVLLISYTIWKHKIYQEGYESCQAEITKAVAEGEKQREKKTVKIKRLPDDSLRREYCKFVRDADMPTCLRDLKPFRP